MVSKSLRRNEDVIQFIDKLDGKKHIGLIYDDSDFAKLLKFRFIKNGLQNGENCVYLTDEDSGKIIIEMINYGIPVKNFQTNKIVVYHQHDEGDTREEIENNAKKSLESIKKLLVPPFRIVGRIVPNVGNIDGASVQMGVEKKTHENFHEYGGIVMCAYDLFKIEKSKRKKWIAELCANHHYIVNISKKEGNTVVTTA